MSYKLVKVLLLRNLTEDDCRVMTTETKGVAQCHADITLTRSVERKVEVGRNCGVEVLDIDSGRNGATGDRHNAGESLDGCSSAQQVSRH